MELVEKFGAPSSISGDLIQVCMFINSKNPTGLKEYLKERFSVESFSDKYKILDYLPVNCVITVNIDNLLYRLTESSTRSYINNIAINGPSFRDRRAIDFIPLQGLVTNIEGEYLFGISSIASIIALDPDKWNVITERLSLKPTMFLGFDAQDMSLLLSLRYDSSMRKSKDRWIILSENTEEGTIEVLEALGFQVIISDIEKFLDYITKFAINDLGIDTIGNNLSSVSLFPDEVVPDINNITLRPTLDFYQGAPPQWSDIYIGNLHKTRYFNVIKNIINSEEHGIIVGIPGCGKTTLLMQLAIEGFRKNYKLITNSITIDKAKLIINRLQGARSLIFVDNFTDSLEAFILLANTPNIQVVGSDRDYNFGIVNHLIDKRMFSITNVTEISPEDIQRCFNALPESIRKNIYSNPKITKGLEPSLFEIMQENVNGSKLKDRYLSVLDELSKNDARLAEILVLICYLERSRTPATIDILLSYGRNFIKSYKDLYDKCDQLGKLISDGTGMFDLRNEFDYFSPRSLILSEAVVDNVSSNLLKSVLTTFVKNVSPYRIHRYDIFKKSAFDHRIIGRAFRNPEEGTKFYESVYNIDDSPYVLQQQALYLSNKNHHVEAFTAIDKALTASGRRIWSIRNSHAIILFRANIPFFQQSSARDSLKESMEILIECYKWDKRKPFHAHTFADQAIKYWNAYHDDNAREYLLQAQVWLSEEKNRSPWNRTIGRLLLEVERCLK